MKTNYFSTLKWKLLPRAVDVSVFSFRRNESWVHANDANHVTLVLQIAIECFLKYIGQHQQLTKVYLQLFQAKEYWVFDKYPH